MKRSDLHEAPDRRRGGWFRCAGFWREASAFDINGRGKAVLE